MNTLLLDVEKDYNYCIKQATDVLLSGNVIIFPTDTVYGIGCLYDELKAVEYIYQLKERQFSKPLAAYFYNQQMMLDYLENPSPKIFKIASKFMPGAITLVAKKSKKISDIITSNFDTLGVRIPNNTFLLELIKSVGKPIVGTSANLSNHSSAKTAQEAFDIFNGLVPLIIKDDKTLGGIESTVFAIIDDKFTLIREGAIPEKHLIKIIEEDL